jgi:type IV secretory pathway VirB9-like protein
MRIRVALFVVVLLSPAAAPSPLRAQTAGIREVTATDRNVIPLNTRLRYTTMIVLPDGDEILDVICGDRDFWVVSAVQNVAHVKPAKADAETNLNLVTARGTIYSFERRNPGPGSPT